MSKAKVFIAIAILLVLIAGFFTAYYFLRKTGEVGAKTIQVEVIADGASIENVSISTDAAYLREALEERGMIAGDESAFGLFVKTVSGRTANDDNQEWWSFSKSGEMLMTGVDDTPIEDGDSFEITLVVGYEW